MISVIIPSYNRAPVLPRAVESVLAQTYADLELIVVDDCSTDGTLTYLESIDDARVRIVRMPENGGACAARNRGIAEAVGDCIAFQDSDDAWRPDKLERQIAALEASGADVCVCRMERHGFPQDAPKVVPSLPAGMVAREEVIFRSMASTQTILARRSVFSDALFDPDMPRFQDYEWSIRASERHGFVLVDEVLVDAYLQDDSITSTDAAKMLGAYRLIADKHSALAAADPRFHAELLARMAECTSLVGEDARPLFWASWRANKTPKAFAKAVLSSLGLMGRYYAKRDRHAA